MEAKRIFVVEDESIVSLEIQSRLKSLGYQVAGTASSGDEAIRKVLELKPDLILMDIRIKGNIDGIDTAAEIHKHLEIPVIFLTAYADEATLQRAKVTDPFGYIIKPFEERELEISIEIALFKVDDKVYALSNICPHQQTHLIHEGFIEDGKVACPVHGWMFELETGNLAPNRRGLQSYEVMIIDNNVCVKAFEKKVNW